MTQIFSNNAGSELAGTLSIAGTTLTLAAGTGARFPAPTGGDFFLGTLYEKDVSGNEINIEVVKVTNRIADTLTIVRDFESMTGDAGGYGYPSGVGVTVYFDLRWTAYAAAHAEQSSNKDAAGGYPGLTLFKLNLKNSLGTITSWFTTAATAARTWTMPDKDGTVAMLSDITGTNSGTNTGDETTATIKTKLGVTTLSGSNTGDQTLPTLSSLGAQATLVSGTNIKTVGGVNLLGSGNIATGDVTLTGTQTLTNKTLTGLTETVYALTGTTPAFLESNGSVQTWTLSGASTPTDSLTAGQSILLSITPGAYSVTWPAGTIWTKVGGSGAAPTLFTAGKTHVLLWKIASTLYGTHAGDSV